MCVIRQINVLSIYLSIYLSVLEGGVPPALQHVRRRHRGVQAEGRGRPQRQLPAHGPGDWIVGWA